LDSIAAAVVARFFEPLCPTVKRTLSHFSTHIDVFFVMAQANFLSAYQFFQVKTILVLAI